MDSLKSLNNILESCLRSAEHLYGARAYNYKIVLNPSLSEEAQPDIVYHVQNSMLVLVEVRIQKKCLDPDEKIRAIFQIGHEVLHSLMPSSYGGVNFLEEGIAVCHSLYCMNKLGNASIKRQKETISKTIKNLPPKYQLAYDLICQANLNNPHIIKKLRVHSPFLSKIQTGHLKEYGIEPLLISKLLNKFN